MRSQPKVYFILPNTDIAPNTAIQLGQIVPSLREAHRALFAPGTLKSFTATKHDFKLSLSDASSISTGLLARFLAQLSNPVSGRFNIEKSANTTTHWAFNSIDTIFFEPNQDYIDGIVENTLVQKHLTKTKLSAVYIVTGLKIARGASYSRFASNTLGSNAKIKFDATALTGTPVSAGSSLAGKITHTEQESCTSCSDFVWAIRIRKVRISFWSKRLTSRQVCGGELSSCVENTSGGINDGWDVNEESEDEEREIEEIELEGVDLGVRYTPKGFRKTNMVDEFGEECAGLW